MSFNIYRPGNISDSHSCYFALSFIKYLVKGTITFFTKAIYFVKIIYFE